MNPARPQHDGMKIVLSLRCFDGWSDSRPGIQGLRTVLPGLAERVDGFEIVLGHSDVISPIGDRNSWMPAEFSHLDPKLFTSIRSRPLNIGRLEALHNLSPKYLREFALKLKQLAELTGIVRFTVRGEGIAPTTWSWLQAELYPDVRLCIENSQTYGSAQRGLDLLRAALDGSPLLSATLNIGHLLKVSPVLQNTNLFEFVAAYRSRIEVVQMSIPEPRSAPSSLRYSLCSGHIDQGVGILFALLPQTVQIVLDGRCDVFDDEPLEREVTTFRVLTTSSRIAA